MTDSESRMTDSESRPGTPSPRPGQEADVDLIAHRGFAGRHPENTVAAFRAAAAVADWVELDAMPTAGGDPVVVHDGRLGAREGGGLTDATGVVWETPTGAVTDAEVFGSGETVPTLAAAVAAVPADVGLHVELKNPGTDAVRPDEALDGAARERARERWAPFVERVLAVLREAPNDVCYSSFCEGALAAVRARSSAPVAVLTRDDPRAALRVAERHDAAAIHPHWSLVLPAGADGDTRRGPAPSVDVVARAHDAGRAVNAWTVATRSRAARLRAAGVDGLIADVPVPVGDDP
jgi:glycerophosphoryl diester phosphodiesterase